MTGYLYRGRPELARLNARIMADRAASPGGKGPAGLTGGHGTAAGARRHWRNNEPACPACAAASAEAAARRRAERAERGGIQ